jgi:hypothetical protein
MKALLLNRKTAACLFLAAYIAFFLTSVTHYHSYSLFNNPGIVNQKSQNEAAHHFLTNDHSFCLVSHFSNSILDLKFTSKNIKIFFAEPEKLIHSTKKELPQNSLLACILYRAPPLVFS